MKTKRIETERYCALLRGELREKFELFRNLLLEYNKKYNLTSITEEKEVFYKHFLDSVAGESLFPLYAKVAEVGSGAGFPSLPLKLVRDDLTFVLLESTGKKCDFLRTAVDKLALSGVTVLNARAEEAARDALWRETFDACTARAVARLNTLAEYCLPFVKKGGVFIAYKGSAETAEAEREEGTKAVFLLGGGKTKIFSYELPEGYGERTLIKVTKERETPEKYPRGNGKERSKPIA